MKLLALAMSLSASATDPTASSCAVVGTGVLGTSLCHQILQDPSLSHMKVTGITKTSNRHESIKEEVLVGDAASASERFALQLTDEIAESDNRFDNVVFCAPPSGFDDYPAAVQDAVQNVWSGKGVFVFTSSGAVYTQESGVVTETTPVARSSETDNPRVARMLGAEEACLSSGGTCIRLSGLYNLQRGAHNFWLMSGKDVAGSPDGLINQVHYEDAAGVCLAAIKALPWTQLEHQRAKCMTVRTPTNIWIGSHDTNPLTHL